MHYGLAATELVVKMIQEERMREAERRRLVAKNNASTPMSQEKALRTALGPGIQFGSVTEGVLETVTGDRASQAAC